MGDGPTTIRVRLLALGELSGANAFDALIRALAAVAAPAVRLLIAGDGPDRAALAAQIAAAGLDATVALPGAVERARLVEIMQRADVLILPRTTEAREGLPAALPVAMASGLCVIASDVGSVGNLIDDGRTGLLVPPGDEAALQRALRMVTERPPLRRELGEAAAMVIRGVGRVG